VTIIEVAPPAAPSGGRDLLMICGASRARGTLFEKVKR
jgi:hypothetical protein